MPSTSSDTESIASDAPSDTQSSPQVQDSSTRQWKPPKGYVKVSVDDSEEAKLFDYDTIKNNPDLELWIMRVPLSIKTKHLENLTIQLPPSSSSAQTIGSIDRKDKHYNVRLLPSNTAPAHPDTSATEAGGLGEAEELESLSILLPRAKTNSLVLAPRPPALHLLVTQTAPFPTPPPSDQQLYTGPPQPRSQPLEKLVHVFQPIGSLSSAQPKPQPFPMNLQKDQPDSGDDDDDAEQRPKKKRRKDEPQSEPRPEKSKKKKHAQKAE